MEEESNSFNNHSITLQPHYNLTNIKNNNNYLQYDINNSKKESINNNYFTNEIQETPKMMTIHNQQIQMNSQKNNFLINNSSTSNYHSDTNKINILDEVEIDNTYIKYNKNNRYNMNMSKDENINRSNSKDSENNMDRLLEHIQINSNIDINKYNSDISNNINISHSNNNNNYNSHSIADNKNNKHLKARFRDDNNYHSHKNVESKHSKDKNRKISDNSDTSRKKRHAAKSRSSVLIKTNQDDPNILLKYFMKSFRKYEKIIISQVIDYDIMFSSSDSCLRYVIEGYSIQGKVYKVGRAKDVSDFSMRNCIR